MGKLPSSLIIEHHRKSADVSLTKDREAVKEVDKVLSCLLAPTEFAYFRRPQKSPIDLYDRFLTARWPPMWGNQEKGVSYNDVSVTYADERAPELPVNTI
ncbi:hypothetical protein M404DRAFT_22558 [Pisolithus tinctorius Marx 270]|uniref:Uncharacterized protein n=1 Tax=Pisolithus tinctorius Marx 270 TaxID=870435 RepID=A0A0C3P629_PISTI|nr:hypothetical protein M404DRAFT_22558 [Pisolithus tinctorius Marx 270]